VHRGARDASATTLDQLAENSFRIGNAGIAQLVQGGGFVIQERVFAQFLVMLRKVFFRADDSQNDWRVVSMNRAVLQPKSSRP
jgi:hypothetical protein